MVARGRRLQRQASLARKVSGEQFRGQERRKSALEAESAGGAVALTM